MLVRSSGGSLMLMFSSELSSAWSSGVSVELRFNSGLRISLGRVELMSTSELS